MNRSEFQILSRKRLREAKLLFRSGLYEGSYHLAGLAVECATKACIARGTKRYEFPDKTRALESFDHNLDKLIKTAGLNPALNAKILNSTFAANWNVVRNWRIESRYDTTISKTDAQALLLSITNPTEGVMQWLRTHW